MCDWRSRGKGGSSPSHKFCIALSEGCLTHFHVSSTNATVIFSLLSVIYQAAYPDNYPAETPDQNCLILSLPRTHTHTHTHACTRSPASTLALFDFWLWILRQSSVQMQKLHIQNVVCNLYFTHVCDVCLWMCSSDAVQRLRPILSSNTGGHCAFRLMESSVYSLEDYS